MNLERYLGSSIPGSSRAWTRSRCSTAPMGTDEYLMAWEWGEFSEVEGTADEAADSVADRIDAGFPGDFVARIRDMHRDGKRDPTPGAVNHWLEE